MTRIAMVATGGTIQNTDGGRLPLETVVGNIKGRYSDASLWAGVDLEFHETLRAPSESFGPTEWLKIARAVQAVANQGSASGIVVTHGTFTAEATGYVLNLVETTTLPIVVVVSQVNHLSMGNDGDRNLLDAIRVADSREARDRGVMLVQGGSIHGARDVRKENGRPDGFTSGLAGVFGTVDVDGPAFYRRGDRRHTSHSEFSVDLLEELPRVDILAVYPGADRAAVDAYLAAGARGIVTAGYPYSGVPTVDQMRALHDASDAGVVVAFASQGRGGRVPSEESAWWVRCDDLSPQKARILLSLALAAGIPKGQLQRVFDQY